MKSLVYLLFEQSSQFWRARHQKLLLAGRATFNEHPERRNGIWLLKPGSLRFISRYS